MDVKTRVREIHRVLKPMRDRDLITEAQAEDCARGIENLAESFGDGTHHHHDVYTHEVLVAAIFNWCTPEAREFALQHVNIEYIAYDDDGTAPTNGG